MKNVLNKQTRFSVAFVVALVAAVIAAEWASWDQALLVGWDVGAAALLVMLWHDFAGHNAERTAVIAKRDDMNRSMTDIVLVVASLASIAAVAIMLTGSGKRASLSVVGFGLLSIVISWAIVHSVFMLRYAAMYYQHSEKGIDFNSSSPPRFSDFAYLAFTIGMTYQVSDTSFKDSAFRGAALRHALLSFVFGTAIIATTINFIASLAR